MDGKVVIGTELDTKSFDEQIKQTEDKLNRLERAYEKASKSSGKFKPNEQAMANLRKEIEKTRNTLIDLKAKQENLKGDYTGIGSSLKDIVSKVTKWGLAIFGVRSAYMGIRQAMSILSSENEQIKTDVEYMRWILAQTLKPVVEWIIKGLYMVLTLVNMISKALFRYDFLSGKGAENFKQAKINSGDIAQNLKNANKQLAGFDEMNVLSDTSSSGGASGGAGGSLGDWQMPDFSGFEQQIEELKNNWMVFGEEMRTSLFDMPFSVWTDAFGNWDVAMYGITETVYGLWEVITGFFEFFKGLIDFIVGLITGDTELIKQGIYEMLEGVWKFIDGVINTIVGLITSLVGIVIGVVRTIWDVVVSILKVVGKWIYDNVISPIANFFVGLWNGIVSGVSNAIKFVRDIFNGLVSFFSGIINKIMGFFRYIGTTVGDVIGGAFKGVINGVLGAIENILNFPIKSINKLIKTINEVPGIDLKTLSTFKLPRLAKGGIINMPGKGIAIGGERGAEGVIPLTDSQQMALLGEAIGKYININATIPVYVGNRQIARELRKINAEDEFAGNG